MDAPPTQQRRTQAERRSESEEALLAAAAELVAERGIDGASLASIGERAGTSRGLPAHHFGSKDGLVARLASRAQDRILEASIAALARRDRSNGEPSGLEALRTTIDTYLDRFEHPTADDRALIVMWGATFASESSVEGMLDAERRSLSGWAELVEFGQRDGSIRPDADPTATAVLIQGLIRGVAALLLTDADLTEMGAVRESCETWVTAALAAPGAPV